MQFIVSADVIHLDDSFIRVYIYSCRIMHHTVFREKVPERDFPNTAAGFWTVTMRKSKSRFKSRLRLLIQSHAQDFFVEVPAPFFPKQAPLTGFSDGSV